MSMNVNGCSVCPKGEERYERFELGTGRRAKVMVQYDYRAENGELFACVADTLDECRARRNEWLTKLNSGR